MKKGVISETETEILQFETIPNFDTDYSKTDFKKCTLPEIHKMEFFPAGLIYCYQKTWEQLKWMNKQSFGYA